ncbi:MAG: helix-turn-helix domain-containing protein [Bdellovibrionota bacterium]
MKNPFKQAIAEGDLGTYLKLARERKRLSQGDVASALKMAQFQSISQWERNFSGSVPLPALKKLIDLYELDADEVYQVLLRYQQNRLEAKQYEKFYGRPLKRRSNG